MFTARIASEPGGAKCATARKIWCVAHNFSHVHTPADPTRTSECNFNPWGRKFRRVSAGYAPTPLHGDRQVGRGL
eukprot:7139679-Prymnesium_polylepis.1